MLDRGAKKRFVEKLGGWFVNALPVRGVARSMIKAAEDESIAPTRGDTGLVNVVSGNTALSRMAASLVGPPLSTP